MKLSAFRAFRLRDAIGWLVLSAVVVGLPVGTGTASAAGTVAWRVEAVSKPSVFSANDASACESEGKCDRYQLLVLNAGDEASSGPITLEDILPAGITSVEVRTGEGPEGKEWQCSEGTTVTCTLEETIPEGRYAPYLNIEVSAPTAEMMRSGAVLRNAVTVQGGGATGAASAGEETKVTTVAPPFEVSEFAFEPAGANGTPLLQAGGHPWAITTRFGVPSVLAPPGDTGNGQHFYKPTGSIENAVVELPMGFIGDPQATEKCAQTALRQNACPPGSEVGVFGVSGGIFPRGDFGFTGRTNECCSAVYNMVPESGYPAEFGFAYAGVPVYMYASVVHTPAGYRTRVAATGLLERFETTNVTLTFFGDPGQLNGHESDGAAFLSNPTTCSPEGLSARIELESWGDPGHPVSREAAVYPRLTGCNLLQFEPSLSLEPTPATEAEPGTSQADEPSAFTTDLKVPQSLGFGEDTTPELKTATVTLPAGVSLNPAAGQGLIACRATGPEGINIGSDSGEEVEPDGRDLGDPEASELGAGHAGGNGSPYDDGLYHVAPGHCPAASTVGTAEVTSPLLALPLHGTVYVAQPDCGGEGQAQCTEADAEDGGLFKVYLEVSGSGVIVKLLGTLSANPQTGQLTASFNENPQFPFSELKLHIDGGSRAPLANPQTCGQASTSSTLEPWSAPETLSALTSSAFTVTGCGSTMPFAPSFVAGTTVTQAGAYTPFTLMFSRQDGEQDFSGLTETMPQGLLAKLAGIPLCGEIQANSGSCGPESQIGTVTVGAGAGGAPIYETGKIYLTGPYNGGPFGVAVVVPAVAGPFNLGNVVIRGSIRINPSTAQATVVSNPLPTILDGVLLRVRTVNVTLNRETFTFNPTSCSQQQLTASISAEQGATVNVASPFAVTGCAGLPFKPSFAASTQGRTSRASGASLTVEVTQKAGEANIHKVDLQLPPQLPTRLTTLQGACAAAQFDADPAGCPAGSVIGTASAVTPVLSVPLTGPAYLVSHGGAAFPDVEFVLQGEGVQIILDGETDIKKGITYSNFETVPDAPISSFETVLPEGRHSALTANGKNLCQKTAKKTVRVRRRVTVHIHGRAKRLTTVVKRVVATPSALLMPTTIIGQNGAVVKQSTRIAVTECPEHRATKKTGRVGSKTK